MSHNLRINGTRLDRREPDRLAPFGVVLETTENIGMGSGARGESELITLKDVADEQLLEIEYADGIKEYLTAAELLERVRQQSSAAGERGVVDIPISFDDVSRGGLGQFVMKTVRLLRYNPPAQMLQDLGASTLADIAAPRLAKWFEGKLKPGPGLYPLEPNGLREGAVPIGDGDLTPSPHPLLVFLHGTASSTDGSFRHLFDWPEFRKLHERYRGRILTLQHPTFSLSPAENALELVGLLPNKSRLHLVSHSRGGLIGEFLCRGPIEKWQLDQFRRLHRPEHEIEIYEKLSSALAEKELQIERFVRVACPASGTILASDRFPRYLSVLLNLMELIPALAGSVIFGFAKSLFLALIEKRADPAEIPGIEAMMPESPVIRLLNLPSKAAAKSNLDVIAGDIEGEDRLGRLGVFAADKLYQEMHDLVVNTRAMFGGAPRENAYAAFHRGAKIYHFSYFENDQIRSQIRTRLTEDEPKEGDGFKKIETLKAMNFQQTSARSAVEVKGTVVFVPGAMACQLGGKDDEHPLWLNPDRLAREGIDALDLTAQELAAKELVANPYQALLDALAAAGYEVAPVVYDWRQSAAAVALRIGEEIEKAKKPVYVVAHSQGCLAASLLFQTRKDLAERWVMLAPLWKGSWWTYDLLGGQHRLARQLGLLTGDPLAGVQERFRSFPGMLELLPEDEGKSLLEAAGWRNLGAAEPDLDLLTKAKAVRAQIEKPWEGVSIIAARGMPTLASARGSQASWVDGDGVVAFDEQHLGQTPVYLFEAWHGDLPSQQELAPALMDLLERGRTDRVTQATPGKTRAVEPPAAELVLFPNADELLAGALATRPPAPAGTEPFAVKVEVMHGDLRNCGLPLAVGHYAGDTIVGAEWVLDKALDFRLSRRHAIHLYPGPDGTSDVILAPNCKPVGALVVGLGDVGSLSGQKLTRGVTEVALKYAMSKLEEPGPKPAGQVYRPAGFASLLIGTRGGKALSVDTSVAAILRGALDANRILQDRNLWNEVRIDFVRFVELHENLAIYAARAIRSPDLQMRVSRSPSERLEADPYMQVREGGRPGSPTSEYETGWWRRIQVAPDEHQPDDLVFTLLTDRAGARQSVLPRQRQLVEELVAKACQSSTPRDDLSVALFELLFPNELKDEAEESADLVLVLSGAAANLPWEMLAERGRDGRIQPMGVRIGIVRQLTQRTDGTQVRAAYGNRALVIGEPFIGEGLRAKWPPLPAAAEEARVVTDLLARKGYQVTSLIGSEATPLAITTALFQGPYRIIHVAGHGEFDKYDSKKSGIVMDNNQVLSAAIIERMRPVPDLIFLNACHSGQQGGAAKDAPPYPLLAPSISEAVIKIGVRAAVVAGWAVNDKAAQTFAKELYRQLLQGEIYGRAVHEARKATYEKHRETNTWGAYQCYGEPGFVLNAKGYKRQKDDLKPVAKYEVIERLTGIRQRAGDAMRDQRAKLLTQVRDLRSNCWENWLDGATYNAFGAAYADLGDFDSAIQAYEQARQAIGSEAPLKAIEQLANLHARQAGRLRIKWEQASDAEKPELKKRIGDSLAKAHQLLKWVSELGNTPERLSLLGSTSKRMALAETGAKRRKALKNAREFYQKAHELNLASELKDPYPWFNWLALEWLDAALARNGKGAAARARERREFLEKQLKEIRDCVDSCVDGGGFSKEQVLADLALVGALSEVMGKISPADGESLLKQVVEAYGKAFQSGLTPKRRSSSLEQIDLTRRLLDQKPPGALDHFLRELYEKTALQAGFSPEDVFGE